MNSSGGVCFPVYELHANRFKIRHTQANLEPIAHLYTLVHWNTVGHQHFRFLRSVTIHTVNEHEQVRLLC